MTINKLLDSKLDSILEKHSTHLYLGWVLFIALITLIPGKSIPDIIDWNFLSLDKAIHFTLFSILSLLGSYSFSKASRPLIAALALSILLAVLYGTIIEYLQTMIPDRGFDYADLAANIGGALVGGAYFLIRKRA
jgi:hypothetical protein